MATGARLCSTPGWIVYLILCIGFFVPELLPRLIHFDLGCNLVDLLLGLWGVYVGYFARQTTPAPAA